MIAGGSILRSLCAASLAAMAAATAYGQTASVVRSGSFEIGPFVGASYGLDKFRVMGGGNVTYSVNKYILPYFEYSYLPGLPRTQSGSLPDGRTFTHTFKIPLSDIHGGVHIRMPIFRESRVVPYLAFGMGVIHFPTTGGTVSYTGVGGQPASLALSIPGESNFTINGGGGLRFYVGRSGRFGFRTEAKVYKPTTGAFSDTTIGKVEAGVFFQLR